MGEGRGSEEGGSRSEGETRELEGRARTVGAAPWEQVGRGREGPAWRIQRRSRIPRDRV